MKGSCSLNDQVWIRVTEKGMEVYECFYRRIGMEPPPLKTDAEGRTRMCLWQVMEMFGPAMHAIGIAPIEMTIVFE
jgi:hypothetical protein